MRLSIVDVFAERPLAGNQLAVVRDAATLSAETMQSIAREMNFSETTFVTGESPGKASARIFTPDWELPFAGHPTLGTAFVLSGGREPFDLTVPKGTVRVSFRDGIAWMTPPPVTLGTTLPLPLAAALIGLEEGQLEAAMPAQLGEVGPVFALLPVRDLAALRAATLDATRYEEIQRKHGVHGVFVFTEDSHSPDADFAARMFFRSGTLREDPATGSANSVFAAYLREQRGGASDVVVDQGVEINRPSRLYLSIGATTQVGGKVWPVAEGVFSPRLLAPP